MRSQGRNVMEARFTLRGHGDICMIRELLLLFLHLSLVGCAPVVGVRAA